MTIVKGLWVNIYPCEDCGRVLGPKAFYDGAIYRPCYECGGRIGITKSGRRIYDETIVTKRYFFGLFKRQVKVQKLIKWEIKK